MDAAQRGTLNHEILERTYRHLQEENAAIHPDNLAETVTILREVAAEVLADAPRKLGFRESALWEHEKAIILRKLEKFIELDFSAESPISKKFGPAERIPYLQEAAFGLRDTVTVEIDLGDEAGTVKVLGYIDRIDQQDDGVIVIDYKTGSTKIPVTELEAGRNFQMMVYLLAAEKILATHGDASAPVKGGAFWHLSDRKLSGALTLDGKGQQSIEQAKAHLADHITRGRKGDFAVQPNKPDNNRCARYCDFHELCRVSITHRYKG
jgi:ATP-dependent helicase/DNAse subunit B